MILPMFIPYNHFHLHIPYFPSRFLFFGLDTVRAVCFIKNSLIDCPCKYKLWGAHKVAGFVSIIFQRKQWSNNTVFRYLQRVQKVIYYLWFICYYTSMTSTSSNHEFLVPCLPQLPSVSSTEGVTVLHLYVDDLKFNHRILYCYNYITKTQLPTALNTDKLFQIPIGFDLKNLLFITKTSYILVVHLFCQTGEKYIT